MRRYPAERLAQLITSRVKHGRRVEARTLLHWGDWALISISQRPGRASRPTGEGGDEHG